MVVRPGHAVQKQPALVVLLSLAVLVLTCRPWNNPLDPVGNRPPDAPSSPQPVDSASGRDTLLDLAWSSADPDKGDTVLFDIYLGRTLSSPLPLVQGSWPDTTFRPVKLSYLTQFYWRVVARDNHGESAAGPVWSFKTGSPNRAPNRPFSPQPESGSAGASLRPVLSWRAGDPDSGDTVVYDVYFGVSDSPPRVALGRRETTYAPRALGNDSVYYWRVVSRDNHSASTQGSLWQFRTAGPLAVTAPDTGARLRMYRQDTIRWTGGPGEVRSRREKELVVDRGKRGAGFPGSVLTRVRPARSGSAAGKAVLGPGDSVVVYHSTNDGLNWTRLGKASSPGYYAWQVPAPVTQYGRVRVKAWMDGDTMGAMSGRFEVYDTNAPTPVTVTSPNDTCRWIVGTQHDVKWTGGADGVDSTVVYYSSNGGLVWLRQPGVVTTPGTYPWTVPSPASSSAQIEVRAYCLSRVVTGRSTVFQVVEPQHPDSVIAIVHTGTRPRAMAWDSLDNRVFVANYSDSNVAVLDGSNNTVITTVPTGSYPSAVMSIPGSHNNYVTSELANNVKVIRGSDMQVIATVQTGQKPVALCWNRTSNKYYTANNRDSSVTVIDAGSNQVIRTVQVRANPSALYWEPVNNRVWVANFGTSNVSVIDGEGDSVVATVPCDYAPDAIVGDTMGGEVYVAHRNSGKITVIDAATSQVVTTITVGQEPWALVWNHVGNRVYCANSASGTVSVVDPANHQVVANPTVGAQPRALLWPVQVGKLYVANNGDGTVSVIDCVNNQVLVTIPVGAKPNAFCYNTTRNKVYVANYDDGTVTVLGSR